MRAQASRVVGAIEGCPRITNGWIILVGDESAEMKSTLAEYENILPDDLIPGTETRAWQVKQISRRWKDGLPNYKKHAQLLIAEMRAAAFDAARKCRPDFCWRLARHVLPPENGLDVMLDTLGFDRGFYSIAFLPYNSQGGGPFLGGRGTPENPILPNRYEDERLLSPAIRNKKALLE